MNEAIPKLEIAALLLGTSIIQLALSAALPDALLIDLPVIMTICLAWRSSPVAGAASGTVFGLIHDGILGLSFGVNGLSKTLIGFACANLRHTLRPESYLAQAVLILSLALADNCCVYGLLYLLGQPMPPGFQMDFLLETAVTGLVGTAIFNVYNRIKSPDPDFRDRD